MLAILDYGAGNLTSVHRALESLGIDSRVTAEPSVLSGCSGIIFPGVGAAGQAMQKLESSGLDALLKRQVRKGQPLLGICLGCQILLQKSEEGDVETLGILPGQCIRFDEKLKEENGEPVKIPHMGWNSLDVIKNSRLLNNVPQNAEFYFVHGYYTVPEPEYVIATTTYGSEFCSVFGRDGLWAAQFHPEKSGAPGLEILKNFNEYCMEKSCAF